MRKTITFTGEEGNLKHLPVLPTDEAEYSGEWSKTGNVRHGKFALGLMYRRVVETRTITFTGVEGNQKHLPILPTDEYQSASSTTGWRSTRNHVIHGRFSEGLTYRREVVIPADQIKP